MRLNKMTWVAGATCLGLLLLTSSAQAVVYDDFEDGDYTNNPIWTRFYGDGTVSVETDTGGTETLALKVLTGSLRSELLYSEDVADESDAFEITLHEHCAVKEARLAFQFGSFDGTNYVEFEWSGGTHGDSPRMDLYVDANDVHEKLNKYYGDIGNLIPGDGVLHTVTLGRRSDETCYVYVDDGSLCYLELKNSNTFNLPLERFRIFVNTGNAEFPVTMFLDNIDISEPVEPTYIPGDANKDTIVDEADAAILANNWLSGPGAIWGMGDFNEDGYVNDKDATMMATNWHVGVPAAAVPEPSCLVLLFVAALSGIFLRNNFMSV